MIVILFVIMVVVPRQIQFCVCFGAATEFLALATDPNIRKIGFDEVVVLLRKIEQLEHRVTEVEAENVALKIENTHLKETLKQYAESKASKPPKFCLNYSSQRNEPPDSKQAKRKKTF